MRTESYCWRCAKRGVLFTNNLPGFSHAQFPGEAVAGHLLFVGIQTSSGLGTMSQLQAWVTYRTRPHAAIHDIAWYISSLRVGGIDLSHDNRRGCSQAKTLAVA